MNCNLVTMYSGILNGSMDEGMDLDDLSYGPHGMDRTPEPRQLSDTQYEPSDEAVTQNIHHHIASLHGGHPGTHPGLHVHPGAHPGPSLTHPGAHHPGTSHVGQQSSYDLHLDNSDSDRASISSRGGCVKLSPGAGGGSRGYGMDPHGGGTQDGEEYRHAATQVGLTPAHPPNTTQSEAGEQPQPAPGQEGAGYGSVKSELSLCYTCCRPIKDQYLLKVTGFTFHSDCLRCTGCDVKLSEVNTCYVKAGNVYCKQDYHKQFGTKCSKCSRNIQPTDWVRRAKTHVYHLACFACDSCKRQLSTGEEFALQDNRVLCKSHYVESIEGNSGSDTESGQKAKNKRVRTTFSEDQLSILHANFQLDSNPDGQDLERIASITGLSKRVTQVWFQNSRARQKKHQQQGTKHGGGPHGGGPHGGAPVGPHGGGPHSHTPPGAGGGGGSMGPHGGNHTTGSISPLSSSGGSARCMGGLTIMTMEDDD